MMYVCAMCTAIRVQSTQPVFKARQVSKRMLQGPQFHTLPSRKPLTETASPMLLTRTRASRKGESQQAQEPSHVFKAAPAPKRILAKPQSLPRAKVLGVTQPAEFNLASSRRHELYQQQMQQKIEAQQAAELAQAEFKVRASVQASVRACACVRARAGVRVGGRSTDFVRGKTRHSERTTRAPHTCTCWCIPMFHRLSTPVLPAR